MKNGSAAEAAEMARKLTGYLQREMPGVGEVEVANVQRIAGGLSTENWRFDARWGGAPDPSGMPLVLRCASANEIVEANREHEYLLLRAIEGQGIPAPKALWMDRTGDWFGRPAMVLERRPGRTERGLLGERNALGLDRDARLRIAMQMADCLADIHALDVDRVEHLAPDARPPAVRELALQQAAVEAHGLGDEPELVLAACWLRSHLPGAPDRETIVHGDYRPANVLVHDGDVGAVLDWELAHRGDPAEDLGWYLASFYRQEHFIAYGWSPDQFLQRYAARRDCRPDLAAIRFWQVFAVYKLAIIAFKSMRALARGDAARLGPPPHHLIELLMRDLCRPAGAIG